VIKRVLTSPLARISLGLVLLTTSILLIGDIFFRLGDQGSRAILDARRQLCESLAVQFSVLLTEDDTRAIETTINTVVRRNDDVLSAALRADNGDILVEAGLHDRYWKISPSDKSTPTNAQVPIFNGMKPWGLVEVRFAPLKKSGFITAVSDPFVGLILFVAIMGFIGYFVFMKRTLRHLDPAAVIPDRVQTALDVLAEGVVLVNEKSEIVLANRAFARKMGDVDNSLMGMSLSDMDWKTIDGKGNDDYLPWHHALRTAQSALGVPLTLVTVA
jgi:PAS domain-containing protein